MGRVIARIAERARLVRVVLHLNRDIDSHIEFIIYNCNYKLTVPPTMWMRRSAEVVKADRLFFSGLQIMM